MSTTGYVREWNTESLITAIMYGPTSQREAAAEEIKRRCNGHQNTARRLHNLTEDELDAWQQTRMKRGQERYQDSHMRRYNLVDVMEELLDASNILFLAAVRWHEQDWQLCPASQQCFDHAYDRLNETIEAIIELDEYVPEYLCTDQLAEQEGGRVWWQKD